MDSYTVGFNGFLSDMFKPSRAHRQGDPLSLYLFLICAKGFLTLLEDATEKDLVRVRVGRGPLTINHLLFTDVSMLFKDASKERVENIYKIIST